MVVTKGPLLSTHASGTISETLIYAKNNEAQSARAYTKPKDPRTGAQIGVRVMNTFISAHWKNLTAPQKATWQNFQTEKPLQSYHKYLKYNCMRWAHSLTPTQEYPATEAPPASANPSSFLTGTYHGFTLVFWAFSAPHPWGIRCHLSQTPGYIPARDNLVYIQHHAAAPWELHRFQDLEPGLWYFRSSAFRHNGLTSGYSAQKTVLVLG